MDAKRVGLLALLVVVIGIIGAILGFILGFHKADDPGIVCIKREMGDTTWDEFRSSIKSIYVNISVHCRGRWLNWNSYLKEKKLLQIKAFYGFPFFLLGYKTTIEVRMKITTKKLPPSRSGSCAMDVDPREGHLQSHLGVNRFLGHQQRDWRQDWGLFKWQLLWDWQIWF